MLKFLFFTAGCCLITLAGFSQAPAIKWKSYQKKDFKMNYEIWPFVWKDTSDKSLKRIMDELVQQKISQTHRQFSHTTAMGKIYRLFPDNMPCLEPDSSLTRAMPNGYRHNPSEKQSIPNPLYREKKVNR